MKTCFIVLLLLIVFSPLYAQEKTLNCDSLENLDNNNWGFVAVEQMPEPIGGLDSLQASIRYPAEAINKKISGKVYVLTYIDTLGIARCTKILKGLGFGCDEEAMRVVQTAKFMPGVKRIKKTGMFVSIPIKFILPNEK